ncbi:cytidylyltransferase domain-containing protein [Hugenholtzia roseola]|uniref:cytidylyltransferase domain-containing protein n=1 Tax=Hugenholtzia roseola TaxID=1002 RepID=UPI0003F9EF49|nr:glycosyltransferase family protein [Hugenholtzia roseola]
MVNLGANHKVGIIIQARMGSSRLKGKILLKLPFYGKESVLEQIIKRAKAVENANEVWVASSINAENQVLEPLLKDKCALYRGDEDDVLSRFYEIAKAQHFDTIVRLTADNPCFDPIYIQKAIDAHIQAAADYTYTKGLPLGMNVEVLSFRALETAFQNATSTEEKEHVTPYVTKKPEQFRLHYPIFFENEVYSDWRLTMDTQTDYALMCLLYENLYLQNPIFGFKAISPFIETNPWVLLINKENRQKKIYASFSQEVEDVKILLKNEGFMHTLKVIENEAAQLEFPH